MFKKSVSLILSLLLSVVILSCMNQEQNEKKLINIEIWTYYNGSTKLAFDQAVDLFNETEGKEKRIRVTSVSIDSIQSLVKETLSSIKALPGARKVPNIVSIYPDAAFDFNELNSIVALDNYFTDTELNEFIPSFVEEGRLWDKGPFFIFPTFKSSEIFIYNKTDCDKFEKATGVKITDISSIEKLIDISKTYYNWTDSLTPNIANDGKAFFGIDSLDNYFAFGLYQLGHNINDFTVDKIKANFYKKDFRKIWESYYYPCIKGWFFEKANFRSDDMKMGRILAATGSSAGINYYAPHVIMEDNSSHKIEIGVMPEPMFGKTKRPLAIQQGAGLCVLKTKQSEEKASVAFIKWLSQKHILSDLALQTGYIPSLKTSIDVKNIDTLLKKNKIPENHRADSAKLTAKLMRERNMFAPKPRKNSLKLRNLLKHSLKDISLKDRATVLEAVNKGISLDKATKKFLTDDYFEAWYQNLCKDIIELINEK